MLKNISQEGIKSIEKWRENRLKKPFFLRCAPEGDVLCNFATLVGRPGAFLEYLGSLLASFAGRKNSQKPNTPQQDQLLDPQKPQEGFRRRFLVDLERFLVDF